MRIVFRYRVEPTNNFLGTDGSGDSITIYDNALVKYHHFIFNQKKPASEVALDAPPELVNEIAATISKHWDRLKTVPSRLDNGSLDGAYDLFQFCDLKIRAMNICHCDPQEVSSRNPEYYERYKDNIAFENIVVDAFDDVYDVLKKYEIDLLSKS